MTAPRIVVIGGGITGAFAGYLLAREGAEVTLVERGEIGGEASGKNAGGLNPLHGPGIPGPLCELALASLALHREHAEEVRGRSGLDVAVRDVARLQLAVDARERAELEAAAALHNATTGFSARVLGAAELRRVEPAVGDDAVAGLLSEGNARVDPLAYTRALVTAAAGLGMRVLRDEARGLRRHGLRATAVMLSESELSCDGAVIAVGPFTDAPASWLSTPLAVRPVKGELLLVEPCSSYPATEVTWRGFGVYLAGGGRLWLGGTEEEAGFDREPTASARDRILDGIGRMLPGLSIGRVVSHVAALRPVTGDGMPIVDIPEGWENVCVAGGAGRKGMLFGAALGRAAADLLVTGATRLPVSACSLRLSEART